MKKFSNFVQLVSAEAVREIIRDDEFVRRVPVWNVTNTERQYRDNGEPVKINSHLQMYALQDLRDILSQEELFLLGSHLYIFYVAPADLLSTN